NAYCHPILATVTRPPSPEQTDEALGSFSVNEDGDAVYFGPIAGSETASASDCADLEQRPSFTAITKLFPFSTDRISWDADQALERLFAHLPLEVRAWSLCEIYFRNGCWTGMPIMQSEAVELLNLIYHLNTGGQPQSATPQQVAVLYLIFALGSLVDLDLPAYNADADLYFDFACAAMAVKPLFENPTVVTVQALTLIASYYAHGGRRFSMDGAWNSISLASSISQRFEPTTQISQPPSGMCCNKFTTAMLRQKQSLFWETYSIETIYGISVGRPTGTFLSNISCPYPPDETETEPFVEIFPGYRQARLGYTKEVTGPIMEAFLTAAQPTYEEVLAMDQRIRKFMHSYPLESFPTVENEPPLAFIQRHLIPLFCKIMLMVIHSPSFVEAIRDESVNPLSSSYAASYLAAYRNASEIIKANIRNFTAHPMLFTRCPETVFNAAIIVGTVATRYPNSKTAPHAIVELFTAVDLIEKGAVSSGRARSGLAILRRLRDKAIGVYSHAAIPSPPVQWPNELELDEAQPQLEFDPSIIRYFDSATPFVNVVPLPEPRGVPSFEDAGLFFMHPPANSNPTAFLASNLQHAPTVAQEMQWADFLQRA
ncbi:hypothetical protein B0H14DRAFT_2709166, partial [Mycena olivaceomarginata]